MLDALTHLGLEVEDLGVVRSFYADDLDLAVREADDERVVLEAGETDLVCRRPGHRPRGGLHTHYAFAVPAGEYDGWWDRLESRGYDLTEFDFGSSRSLYCFDPANNCVELGGLDVSGPGISAIFEVVLEVTDLDRSEAFYRGLGFEEIDRGDERRRVRLSGPMDLELWEPQYGIADGRGGVHVDLGFRTTDLRALFGAIDGARRVERADDGVRVTDPDGHSLLFRE